MQKRDFEGCFTLGFLLGCSVVVIVLTVLMFAAADGHIK